MKSTRFDSRFEICLLRKREAKEEENVKELTRESNPRAKRGKFSSQKHKLDDGDHQWHGSPRADDGVHRHILFFCFFYEWFFRRVKTVHEDFFRDGAYQKRYKRVDREKRLRRVTQKMHLQRRHIAVEDGDEPNSYDTKAPQFLGADITESNHFCQLQQVNKDSAAPQLRQEDDRWSRDTSHGHLVQDQEHAVADTVNEDQPDHGNPFLSLRRRQRL